MFKAIHWSGDYRVFSTYADAHHFIMRESDANRLWQIVAAAPHLVDDCKKEKAIFFGTWRAA